MNITEEEMNLRLKSAIGTLDEMIPIEKEGKDIRIAFNPKLLLDALRVIDDEEIVAEEAQTPAKNVNTPKSQAFAYKI